MNTIVVVSYAGALILLYFCVLLFSLACQRNNPFYGKLIIYFGVLPGLAGLVYGSVMFLNQEDRVQGFAVLTGWLLLEMGAMQLRQILNRMG